MNVAHLLTRESTKNPDATALIEGSGRGARRVTFAELNSLSGSGAAVLKRDGVCVGERVLVFIPMSIELYVALVAVLRLGAAATFLDPSAGLKHVQHCCGIAKPAAFIGTAKSHLLRLVSSALRKIPRKYAVGWRVPGATRWQTTSQDAESLNIEARSVDDAALLTFTSGSTGIPKAAVRTHGFLAAQHHALEQAIELHPGEVDLATLPIFALANLASGVTTLIPDADLRRPGFVDADCVLGQAQVESATRSTASPAFFERLLEAKSGGASPLAGFRRIYTGGAPVFPGLLERLQRAAPAARVVAVYGSTEAEPVAHIAWDEVSADDAAGMFAGRGLLAGPPVKEIELRIIPNAWGTPITPMPGDALNALRLPPGEAGEIIVHGEHVLRGYLNGVGDEATKFRVDQRVWHRTGDAGYLDDRGRLWLLGRAEAAIKDRHGTIYPFAVECAASRIEGVKRSALLGYNGRRVLVIEPRTRLSDAEAANIRSDLAWARLDAVLRMKRIPVDKRHNAKVDYPALRAAVARRT